MTIVQVKGKDLSDYEVGEINSAIFREWKMEPFAKEKLADTLFFFLKENDKIIAMGGLKEVDHVIFDNEEFSILGFVEVVANIKGKGYGKMVVTALREHLISTGKSGMGFTKPETTPFYEKCGFKIELNSSQRFVYMNSGKRITDDEGQVIFYLDGKDHFMENVLKKKGDIILPTDGLW